MDNVLRENAVPSSYAKRRISFQNTSSVRCLFSKWKKMKRMQHCTEIEVRRRSGDNNWKLSLMNLMLSLPYCIFGCFTCKRTLNPRIVVYKMLNQIFTETVSRDRFKEIMLYLRFDIKSTRSQRLLNDRFIFISEVWNNFIKNGLLY